jgi:hypothetical protein
MMVLTCSGKLLKNQGEIAENNDKRKQHRSELDNTKRLSGTQKVKFGRDFLGCVESSTNGDLLGERRIFVLPSYSADTEAGGGPNWF